MMYFLQNCSAGYLGNSPMFWKEGDSGYTAWIDEAKKWEKEDAERQIRSTRGSHDWKMWPVSIVEGFARRTVDVQNLRGDIPESFDVNEEELEKWIEEGSYLPEFLRDFHDQKEFFKACERKLGRPGNNLTWVDGQIYTLDRFLRFMAMHGYTFCHTRGNSLDVEETIEDSRRIEMQQFTGDV